MGGGEQIFGTVLYLKNQSTTIVFICVLIVFTLFEGFLHVVEVECSRRGFKGLIKKLYRELMIMGFVSFAILLASEGSDFEPDEWFEAFHFAHIVLLFVGLVFLLQSGLFAMWISSRNKTLLAHDSCSSELLIVDYIDMHQMGGIACFLFDYGLVSIPIPELREKMEYKIIQEFFIRSYNLPAEFKFANYMCMVLKDYVISLVEVRPVTWMVLTVFVVMNYIRIVAIDPIFQSDVCKRYPANTIIPHHRLLAGASETGSYYGNYSENVCEEYTLRYTFVVSTFIFFFILGVFIASEIYMQRLIEKVLDQEETLEWLEEKEEKARMSVSAHEHGDLAADAGMDIESLYPPTAGEELSHGNRVRTGSRSSMGHLTPGPRMGSLGPGVHGRPSRLSTGPRFGSLRGPDGAPYHFDRLNPRGSNPRMSSLRKLETDQHPPSWLQRMGSISHFHLPSMRGSMDSYDPQAHRIFGQDDDWEVYNRRFLYLRCLERIMHVEFNFHASTARRMSMTGSDAGDTHSNAMVDAIKERRSVTSTFFQEAVAGSGYGGSTTSISPHGSGSVPGSLHREISNYQQMKMLRDDMLHARESTHLSAGKPKNGISGIFGGSSPRAGSRSVDEEDLVAQNTSTNSGYVHVKKPPETPTEVKKKTHVPRENLRNRGYSGQYFETSEKSNEVSSLPSSPILPPQTRTFFHKVYEFIRSIMHTFMGHHLGHAAEDDRVDKDVVELQNELCAIFLLNNAELYCFCVEFALLAQSLYMAFWATNLLQIAIESHHPVLWSIALVVPFPINFFLLKQIIFTSAYLKSIVTLDRRVSDKICEDAVDERNVTQRLRKIVRGALRDLELPKDEWNSYLRTHFDQFVAENRKGLTESDFRLFLHSLHVFLTDLSVHRIFGVIDFDRDGILTWENISPIVFPDLQKKQFKLDKQVDAGAGTLPSGEVKPKKRKTISLGYQSIGENRRKEVKKMDPVEEGKENTQYQAGELELELAALKTAKKEKKSLLVPRKVSFDEAGLEKEKDLSKGSSTDRKVSFEDQNLETEGISYTPRRLPPAPTSEFKDGDELDGKPQIIFYQENETIDEEDEDDDSDNGESRKRYGSEDSLEEDEAEDQQYVARRNSLMDDYMNEHDLAVQAAIAESSGAQRLTSMGIWDSVEHLKEHNDVV